MGLLPNYSFKDRLGLIVQRRWIPALITLMIISILGIIATYNIKPVYEAKTKLKFKNINYNSFLKDLASEETTVFSETEQANFVRTEVELIRSVPLIKKTISDLQLTNKQGELITFQQFQKQLQVKQIETTDIVEISYKDSDSKIVAQVVNTLITNYIDNNIFAKRKELALSKDFLNDRLSKTEATLKQVEESIVKIKEEHQIFAPQEAATHLAQTLEEVSRKIITNRSEIAKLKSQSRLITSKLGMNSDNALITVTFNQSLAVQNLTQQLQELELQLIKERSNFTEKNSRISEIQREIKLKQELLQKQIYEIVGDQEVILLKNSDLDIIQELTLELIKLEANNIALAEELEYLVQIEQEKSQKASLIPQFELQLRQLERKLNTSQNAYDLLFNKLHKIEFAEQQNISNVRVISSEIIPQKFVNFYFVYYLVSLLLGLMAAIGVIYLLEITDNSLKSVEEAKKFFGCTWLGIIPVISGKPRGCAVREADLSKIAKVNKKTIPQLIVKENPVSKIHESYQILYSNLQFIRSQNQIKTIVITSAIAQEGKSSIAANLAYTMAQRGENVLLIDANFHSPTQYKIWDIYHNIGLTNLLAEQISPQLVIQKVMTNLDVISSGEIDSSSATILDSPSMQSFIDNCSTIYDCIIIDSPALDITADAITLGKIADGILLIVQAGLVNRSQANFAKELLDRSGQNILGLVLNKFNTQVEAHIYHSQSIDNVKNNQEKFTNSEKTEASLWEIIAHYPKKLENNKFIFDLDSEKLKEISLEELEKNLTYLEQNLERLTQMVKEQEEEFYLQGQTVRKLQKQVNLANISERSVLKQKLLQEKEVKNMLGKTLLGQRRNLNHRKKILNQYKKLLSTKKNFEVQFNGSNNELTFHQTLSNF